MARASKPKTKIAPSRPSGKQIVVREVAVNPHVLPASSKASATFQLFRDDLFGWGTYDEGQESFDSLLKKYGSSTTWVYIAINKIATGAAQIPIQVIRKDRENLPNSIVRNFDKGLLALINQPNPWQSWFEFVESCLVSLEITGNLFVEKVYPNATTDRPSELYVLNPSRIDIVPDRKKFIKGYVYSVNGKRIAFAPEDICHVKYPNPTNDFYGLSPLTAARLAVEMDRGASEWNRNFMEKGGWPGGAITSENELDPTTLKRLKREIKANLSTGKRSAGQVLLLTGGLAYQKLAVTPKELDWLDARRMSRDEILAIYGVPFAVAGLFSTEQTTARSAGVEQQIKQFYRGTLAPRLRRILEVFNRDFVLSFSDNFKLSPDLRSVPALQDDVQTELTRAQAFRTLVASGVPLNYALARFYPEMASVAWGDVAWMNSSMMPVSGPEPGPVANTGGKPNPQQNPPPSEPDNKPKKDLADAWQRLKRRAAENREGGICKLVN